MTTNTIIQFKRSSTPAHIPTLLANGEIAINLADKIIYTYDGSNIIQLGGATSVPGSNTQLLFNDSGTSNASAGLKFNKTSNSLIISNTISLPCGDITGFTYLISNNTTQILDNFLLSQYVAADYIITASANATINAVQMSKLSVITNPTGNAFFTEYNIQQSNGSIISYSVTTNSTAIALNVISSVPNVNVRVIRTAFYI